MPLIIYWKCLLSMIYCGPLSCVENKFSHSYRLTHWGWVMLICGSKLSVIGSDNGLPPDWRQPIIWTNAWILLVGSLGTNFSKIAIKILIFIFKKLHLKMLSGKWHPFCLGLNVLSHDYTHGHRYGHVCTARSATVDTYTNLTTLRLRQDGHNSPDNIFKCIFMNKIV